jgi:hypothetical protein
MKARKDYYMPKSSGAIIFCLLLAAFTRAETQADRNPAPASKQKEVLTGQPYGQEGKQLSEGAVRSVDLCALADEVRLTKDEAAKRNQGWMEIEIQDAKKSTRKKGMPVHSDIVLSLKARERVRFFCLTKQKHQLRIDRFEKASSGSIPGCTSPISNSAPDSPFTTAFPTPISIQIILGPPVRKGCYKFSFTVWTASNPAGTAVDPHLIVKP